MNGLLRDAGGRTLADALALRPDLLAGYRALEAAVAAEPELDAGLRARCRARVARLCGAGASSSGNGLDAGDSDDVVLEFVANPQTLPSSIQSLRRGGRLVFVGYTPEVPMSVLPRELVRSELEIVGSRANTKQELQETMDLVAGGRITPIIDRVIPLESIEDAFAALRDGTPLGRNVLAI